MSSPVFSWKTGLWYKMLHSSVESISLKQMKYVNLGYQVENQPEF